MRYDHAHAMLERAAQAQRVAEFGIALRERMLLASVGEQRHPE